MHRWQRDELIALLAWLDVCIKLEMNFYNTIENHLNTRTNVSGQQEPFSLLQIKQKIADIPKVYGQPSRTTIIRIGSSCIPGLPVELREEIEKRTMEYEESDFVGQMASSNRRDTIDRTEEPDISNDNCLNSIEEMNSDVQKDPQEHAIATLALDEEQRTVSKVRNVESTQPPRRVQCESIPSPSSAQLKFNTLKQKHKTMLLSKEEEIKKLRLKWQEETYELTQQQSKSTQVILELRAQIKHGELANKTSEGAGKNPLEESMYQYMHQNWSLLQRVQEMKKLLGFCQRTPEQSKDWTQQCLREGMATIRCEMTDLLHGHNHNASLVVPVVQKESDMGSLIRSIFGVSSGEEIGLFRQCIAKYGSEPEVIVRAFVSAALKEWVFMSNFPGFAKRNQLLESYRKVIITNDGWKSAHNLEIAAYQSLMDEPSFKSTVIPKLATEFAARLSKALAPLFPAKVAEPTNLDEWPWGQDFDVVASRNFRLVGLFSTALGLKANTVLADNSFEFVVYPPGTKESANTSGEPVEVREKDNADGKIQSWKYSSIHMYRATISVPSDAAADAQLTSRNFVRKTAQERIGASLYEVSACITSEGPRVPSSINELRDSEMNDETINEGFSGNSVQIFECKLCKAVYSSKRASTLHNQKEICGRCSKCGNVCQNKAQFVRHRKEQHPHGDEIVFENSWKANEKNLQDNGMKSRPYSIIMEEGNSSVQRVEGSLRQSHEPSSTHQSKSEDPTKPKTGHLAAPGLACNKCGKWYVYLGKLEQHIREETCGKCLECNIWFETKDLLLAHNSTRHGAMTSSLSSAKDVSGDDTSDSATSDDDRSSVYRGSGVVPPSPVRPKSRKRPSDEEEELTSLSSGDGSKIYECTMCMDTFRNIRDRDIHHRSHACKLEGHRPGKEDIDSTGKTTCKECGTIFTLPPSHKRRKLSQAQSSMASRET